ncbi:HET-domain-containing protein [Lophium mytilinum]|uniref:HET-domain-containing protein n=1 Tax=Lophium mytilinum TaxID=390894 RepID=A0A6A6RCU3_9PEZI|nr:HET-domain-containing protein [Lophium mytilinum]
MPSTSSSTTRKRVGGWLEACERHSCGHSRKAPKWHPTRLLDIGTSSSSAIKLCEAEEIELMADYATLSHRWASQEIPKLTSEGRASMKRGVLPRPLTRTMLDAVQVAREWLNVRYLWIDSLCIIQDSQEDWVTESAMMAEVYRNSYCNIAGAAASTDGLFVDRDVSMVQPYVIDVKWGTEFRAPGQYVFYHDTRWQHSIRYSPLMKRAWCIQEIFLAPRTLHFGSLQVGWECNEAQACETVPLGLDHKPLWIEEFPSAWKDICRIRDQQVSVAPDTHIKLDRPKLYKLWDAVVTRYSLAHLSFVKDKLAALAGIASFVEDLLEDEYLVGMWRSDLARQLCWFGMNPDRCTRPSEYIAPTWSWLSLNNSHISKPDYREYAVFVDIQDAQVLCEPNDRETSKKVRITGGFLDVACFLVPGVLTVKDVAGGRAYKVSGKGSSFPLKFRMDIDIHLHETRDVWLMPVLGGRTLTGLILERRNNDKGAFRRLGMFDKFYWGTHFWELAFESIPGATGTIATESQRLWRPQEPWEDEEPFHKTEAPLRKSRSAFEDWDDVTKPSDGVWFLDISRVVHGNERGLPPPYKKYDGVSRLKIRII